MPQYHVHGIQVTVTSNWTRFLRLVDINFQAFSSHDEMQQSLDVAVSLRKKKWFAHPQSRSKPIGEEEKWGTDIFCEGTTVRLRSESMWIEFAQKPQATVNAWYLLDRRSRIAGWYRNVPSWDVCQRLMRLTVHQPILHMLEQRDMELFHAAAVAANGDALLIVGLNGSGKSSLCFSLLDEFDYMADNFVLWDGEDVLGFPEAVRLPVTDPARSAGSLQIYGKTLIPVEPAKTVLRAKPRALVILTQGSETSISRLSPDVAARRVSLVHDMTHEFPRYTFVGPLSPSQDQSRLASFARSVPAFALTMSDVKQARPLLLDLF